MCLSGKASNKIVIFTTYLAKVTREMMVKGHLLLLRVSTIKQVDVS